MPKISDAFRTSFDGKVPQGIVQLDRYGHFRIVGISAPLPCCFSTQNGQMFAKIIQSVLRPEAEGGERVASAKNSFRRTEQINVGLDPMARIRRIFRYLSKTFQNEMLDICPCQSFGYFDVSGFDRLKSLRVVGNIPLHPRAHPTRTMVATSLS
ncbi:MAG TPA: hypothetical protein VGK96_09050 [Candidatus Sulfotelmatobacter sp.]